MPAAATLVAALLIGASGPSPVFVAPFEAGKGEPAWLPARAEALTRRALRLSGLDVIEIAPAKGVGLRVQGRVKPAVVARSTDQIELALRFGKRRVVRKGPASSLHSILAQVVAEGVHPRERGRQARLAELLSPMLKAPFAAHESMGKAARHQKSGAPGRAIMLFEHAMQRRDRLVPEAIFARARAVSEAITKEGRGFATREELAKSALERAEYERRRGNHKEVQRALTSFVRFTSRRAMRWSLPQSVDNGALLLAGGRNPFRLMNAGQMVALDPRTGVVTVEQKRVPGLVEARSDRSFILKGRVLIRLDADGSERWRAKLPFAPKRTAPGPLIFTENGIALVGEQDVLWLDDAFGTAGQQASGVVALAGGAPGVIVLVTTRDKKGVEIGLLRPGKKTPAWRSAVKGPRDVIVTRDRVALTADEGLLLLRVYNGTRARPPLPLARGARILQAKGRYAVILENNDEIALFDVLAGERLGALTGPGRPLAAYTGAHGASVLFATGDLLTYGRDGRLLDRAVVPGKPQSLLAGHPLATGPVVLTSRGLFAFSEVEGSKPIERDVDALLAAAESFETAKDTTTALLLATEVALQSHGRVARAEGIRARILGKIGGADHNAAAAQAKARALIAADPRRSLPPFALLPPDLR